MQQPIESHTVVSFCSLILVVSLVIVLLSPVNRDRRTLFIKNLPTDVKESEIKEVAPACTEITIKLMRDKKLANRGCVAILFQSYYIVLNVIIIK